MNKKIYSLITILALVLSLSPYLLSQSYAQHKADNKNIQREFVNPKKIQNRNDIPKEVKDLFNDFNKCYVKNTSNNSNLYSSNANRSLSTYKYSGGGNTVQLYRGSGLAWSRDNVYFSYDGSKVTYSTGWQETGWVFPNIVRAISIERYNNRTDVHSYRATKTIGAGTPTPWGDAKVYESTFTDYIHVYGSGGYTIN